MKRAILPCLLLTMMALTAHTAAAQSDFYLDVRVGNQNRYRPYPGQSYYPPNYQPYYQIQQWAQYLSDRWYQYDRWWLNQSYYYKNQTRMVRDYGKQLFSNMRRYPTSQSCSQLENFFRRYYDPYAYNYSSGYNSGYDNSYRDPYSGGSWSDDYSYYPNNDYYDNSYRRQYYGDPYNYSSSNRRQDIYAAGTGQGITDIVRGSDRNNNLEVWSGSLSTVGSILGLVNNQRERDGYNGGNYNFGRYR
ncbi:MAG: hypothetical protein HY303_06990 [Candidatus Wallbacteria bacterium]|nr:hypothetical protein [Candidatus Wallbacteria bacterium]